MEHENETQNDHFCEREGRVPFFSSFSSHSELHFSKNENKNEIENEPKMARK
jgi:hypothetical protein